MKLIMKCDAGHVSTITIDGIDLSWAQEHGRLLDGTSAMYVNGPVIDSTWIGVCQYGRKQPPNPNDQIPAESIEALKAQGGCGARFKCHVEE